MNSRERILAAIEGKTIDHVPLTTWCFGFEAPEHLRWEHEGREVKYWYSKRLEHIHTLPQPWTLEDDFKRAETWLSLGIDDILEVSVPWSVDSQVQWKDSLIPAGEVDKLPVRVREYETPTGRLRHAIRQTGEDPGAGWVVQPDYVPLFEDYNIPRGIEHAVSSPSDVSKVKYLYAPPNEKGKRWFADRMAKVKEFSEEKGLFVQAWSAFGMDAAVWLAGSEGAIMLAMDAPEAFGKLLEIIAETDYERTRLAVSQDGVDMVVQRGWYSSTDFWSPNLFETYTFPHIVKLASLAHEHGKKFGYTITTGVEVIGPRLAEAGVDVLYFIDPVQDTISLEKARELLAPRMTLVGGMNSLTLANQNPQKIETNVRKALEILGSTNRFILHPIDAIFPDTPWEGVEQLIKAWETYR